MKGETWWKWIQRSIAFAAAVSTVQAMALPAVTMEQEALCGVEEHQHGDVCYAVEEILDCKAAAHVHQESCTDENGANICGYAGYLIHSHGDYCQAQDGTLICQLPEIILHNHTEDCWQTIEEIRSLICQQEENILHSHEETCFMEGRLTCGLLELTEHSHDAHCLENSMVLACSMEEHAHTEKCFPEEEPTEATQTQETTVFTEPVSLFTEGTEPEAQLLHTSESREDDVPTVSGESIRFRLFNYSLDINKNADESDWRKITPYFTFRNSRLTTGTTPSEEIHIPTESLNTAHDADGFPAAHATVERTLTNGMPVLDLTRNADGTARADPGISEGTRSLAYLFSDSGDHAVTAYSPGNTILQQSGNRYWYNSRDNAVDYDIEANRFRVRSYAERNDTTAANGTAYGDFLPFNYTGGETIHDPATEDTPYHLKNVDVDYWFGMTMEVDFYQSKDGLLGNAPMVFRFSGDDDVWVFVDDVLVLDLGGTHGTVEGSIDFSTGEVLQYLSWGGANASEEDRTNGSDTSFPTTIRKCFDAAGREPNGGWDESGVTFADYTQHKLTFFYLERGAAVANCKIDFSLPTLPDKSLMVNKELSAEASLQDYLSRQLSYRFRVVKPDGSLFLAPGTAYTLLENGESVGNRTIEADGTFPLYPNQSAQFTRMLEKGGGEKNYIVQEILPDTLTGQYSGIEYSVNGEGGATKTEENPETAFTSYETEWLSAEQSQLVTFRNRVDTSKLCSLKLTKAMEEGSVFSEDSIFPIQVKLGGILLPTGSEYSIEDEVFAVTTPGIIQLKIGQTAQLLRGILSGTAYEITEPGTEDGMYRARYSGTVTPEGAVNCTENGASGNFPLNSQVHVTVTNASFDFSVRIPLSKHAVHNQGTETFSFNIQEVFPQEDGTWTEGEMLPGTSISVTDDKVSTGSIPIGYKAGTADDFYYKVMEQPGNGAFLYDDTFYIVQITVSEGTAALSGIWKNGEENLLPDTVLSFVNHRTANLRITKSLIGGNREESFAFTAQITWNGQPYVPPGNWETDENKCIHFSLCHEDEIPLTGIPWGAEVKVQEEKHPNYIPSYRIEPLKLTEQEGNTAAVTVDRDGMTLHFVNRSAYQLPQTGGSGTKPYTWAALLQITAAVSLLYFQRKRDRKAS